MARRGRGGVARIERREQARFPRREREQPKAYAVCHLLSDKLGLGR